MQVFEHTPGNESFYVARSEAFAALVVALPAAAHGKHLIAKRSAFVAQALTACLRAGEVEYLDTLLNHEECEEWLADFGGKRVGCAHVLAALTDAGRRSHKALPVDGEVTKCAEKLWEPVRRGTFLFPRCFALPFWAAFSWLRGLCRWQRCRLYCRFGA